MATVGVPDDLLSELVAVFGDDAGPVVERALRSEITRHRIAEALSEGGDPVVAVTAALGKDPSFLASVDALPRVLTGFEARDDDPLGDRLRRWG